MSPNCKLDWFDEESIAQLRLHAFFMIDDDEVVENEDQLQLGNEEQVRPEHGNQLPNRLQEIGFNTLVLLFTMFLRVRRWVYNRYEGTVFGMRPQELPVLIFSVLIIGATMFFIAVLTQKYYDCRQEELLKGIKTFQSQADRFDEL